MPGSSPQPPDVLSAGAVVTRKGRQVLLVHRPKYDDWSFPKGKLDPGEHLTTAAVREVAEETGLDIRLGPRLAHQSYEVGNGEPKTKHVHYWVGRVEGRDDIRGYRRNDEIDDLAWLRIEDAHDALTYDYDRVTLEESLPLRSKSYPLIILRHGRARSRKSWRGDDRERTLTKAGETQAEHVVPVLSAYGVRRVVSSTSRRCWSTVAPYADVADVDLEMVPGLSEEDSSRPVVEKQVQHFLRDPRATVLCTHRPVLPWVFEALGMEPISLSPGDVFVVHHRRGKVLATEHHDVDYR